MTQEEGFREICSLIEQQISPSSHTQAALQKLHHFSQFPDFNNYLSIIFARAPAIVSVEVRQAAGLLLKNNLRATIPANLQYIKSELLPCVGAADRNIRSTAGSIITVIVQLAGVSGWPELLCALVQCLDSDDMNHKEGAMDALSKICEDVPQLLDSDIPGLSERPTDVFLSRFLQLFESPNVALKRMSLLSVNQYIMLMPIALKDKYLNGLFVLANNSDAEVRKLVCSAFVQLIVVRTEFVKPYLRNVIEYMLIVNKDSDDEVALQACEFWSAYCDSEELPAGNLKEFLPRLIQVLLSNMVYADDDELLHEEDDEGSIPDREQRSTRNL